VVRTEAETPSSSGSAIDSHLSHSASEMPDCWSARSAAATEVAKPSTRVIVTMIEPSRLWVRVRVRVREWG